MTAEVMRAPIPFDIDEAVEEVWVRAEAAHARSWQAEPGPSAAGSCLRQVGLMYAGATPTDEPSLSSPAATIGSWFHEHFLPLLQDVLGGDVEFETVAGGVRGHGDWYGQRVVVDVKTKGSAALSRIRSQGASLRQLWQGHIYAAGRIAAGDQVDYVILLFIARDTGEHVAVTYAYDPAIAAQALAWFERARTADDPDELPRGGRGPGLDLMCDGCVFRTRCWPNGQATILDEAPIRDVAIESALEMHEEAAERERVAKADKAFAAAMLDGEEPGEYENGLRLRRQSSGARLDQAKAKEILLRLGVVPPMTVPTYSIRVDRAKRK